MHQAGIALLTALVILGFPVASPAETCVIQDRLAEPTEPWVPIQADSRADPRAIGYAVFVEFRIRPSGQLGRGIFVRVAEPGAEPLFPREKRRWFVVLNLDGGAHAIQYSYLDRAVPNDVWVYSSETRRITHSQIYNVEYGNPIYSLCRALGTANLATRIDILAAVVGYVDASPKLRRLAQVTTGCR